jgi:thiol-disulfide isomerase/thioredoxin
MCLRPIALHGFFLALFWLSLIPTATAAERPASFVLHLTNGDFVSGELRGSEDPTVLHWRSPRCGRPLEFPMLAVCSVHATATGPQPKPAGDFCFELVNGDRLHGNVLGVTDEEVEVHSAPLGRVHLRREQIRRFYRWKAADAIYRGPNGLAGWKEPVAKHHWHDEGGQLFTEQSGASLFGDLGLPEKALIEVELSWRRRPDFILALGVDDGDLALQHAFRFEIWDGELVAVGESGRDADVASVQEFGIGEGRVRILAYLDQRQGRLLVLSPSGKPLATLHTHAKNPRIRSGVRLTNTKGDVRLEQVRVTRWNGFVSREGGEDKPRLLRTDGSITYGRLTAFDPKSKQFTIRDGTKDTNVEQGAIAEVFLSTSSPGPKEARGGTDSTTLRVVSRDGCQWSGTLTCIEDTRLTLTCPSFKEPVRLPLAELGSLTVLQPAKGPRLPSIAGKPGWLELEGVHLRGQLVKGAEEPGASCLLWHPDLALSASPLAHGVSGRIVYRDPPPPPRPMAPRVGRVVIRQAGGAVVQRIVQPNGRIVLQVMNPGGGPFGPQTGQDGNLTQVPSTGRRSLQLRNGEVVPGEVLRIDEKGVTFKMPFSNPILVAHDKIQSVELLAMQNSSWLNESKRDRLLTLPRMQKDSPPTHLICSKNGDFLRGRILEMDETRLKVEVRLETREIPRDRVAQVLWLHGDEPSGRKDNAAAAIVARSGDHATTAAADRVQAVRANGNRLTFVAEKADHKTISGTSEFLGPCRVDLAEVDQLLLGTFIEESAAKLPAHPWKLHAATEPKFAQEGAGSTDGIARGTESPLVGQPAFSFRLDLLDGRTFHLAERKGHVVVLDFWATWCGPCLQSMPLIEGVVREFADRGVELLAVDLEEQPQQIKTTLERHKLKIPVALDRDGVVAAKYTVTAIPQTVVIDRDGKIARLFVGGGKKTADALRKALAELTGERQASAP